mmetsp:Transcript_27099/g.88904  ORF Transcript_27099/g.88904 Transcript_27099/m.88904 type:complete len:136 (+) Transcript_27099:2-409(+)
MQRKQLGLPARRPVRPPAPPTPAAQRAASTPPGPPSRPLSRSELHLARQHAAWSDTASDFASASSASSSAFRRAVGAKELRRTDSPVIPSTINQKSLPVQKPAMIRGYKPPSEPCFGFTGRRFYNAPTRLDDAWV